MTQVGGAIVSLRGNCSFCEKAHYAESANASLLVIVYNDSDLVNCYGYVGVVVLYSTVHAAC